MDASRMEPMLVEEAELVLEDAAATLLADANGLAKRMHPILRESVAGSWSRRRRTVESRRTHSIYADDHRFIIRDQWFEARAPTVVAMEGLLKLARRPQ